MSAGTRVIFGLVPVVGAGIGFPQIIQAQNNARPNIIHILVDDVGYDDLGCYGSRDLKTPNIDALAANGMRFTDFYAPHGTSTPSRATLMTGRYAPRVNNGKGLSVLFPHTEEGLERDLEITVTDLLKGEGYTTALYGKWHLGHMPEYLPANFGIDHYLGIPYPNDHGPERLGGTGIRPSGIIDPPVPLVRQTETVKECDNNDLGELPPMFVRESCRFMYQAVQEGKPFYLQYSNIETHTPYFIPRGFEGRSEGGAYGDAVEYMDVCVGILMDMVKRLKIEDNTIVVFTSDNGPLIYKDPELEKCYGRFGETDPGRYHVLRGGKYQERYEGGIRVPCIMTWPGVIPAGTECGELTGAFDLFTLFAEIGGAEIPQDRVIDGKDIMPLVKGVPGAVSPHEVIIGFAPRGGLRSVRHANWKLVLPGNDRNGNPQAPELYDLSKDLGETTDIAAGNSRIVKKLLEIGEKADKAIRENKAI